MKIGSNSNPKLWLKSNYSTTNFSIVCQSTVCQSVLISQIIHLVVWNGHWSITSRFSTDRKLLSLVINWSKLVNYNNWFLSIWYPFTWLNINWIT